MITAQHFDRVINSNDPDVDPYELIKDAVRTHDTHCDDDIVSRQFAGRTGRFLCVGSSEGRDQTLRLLESGWTGVYCEPDPRTFRELERTTEPHQDRVTLMNVAVSPKAGPAPFNLASMPFHSSLLPGWAHTQGDHNVSRVEVHCVTLKQLLTQAFDYIQTDTEGMDAAIVSSVDWAVVPTAEMICTEAGTSVLKQLCRQGDYMLTDLTPTNAFYQHRSRIKTAGTPTG